ncbi:MAG: type II toxin-antitoxin system VapC family toxin [Nitrospiraceae bacterium]|nr:type II toxin-antitoxin system VapC family toxin [Nitrospiraceae bacterium]
MIHFVVDASVAIKWYLPELHSAAAERLLSSEFRLLAPDLIIPEIGIILWKRIMKAELTVSAAQDIMTALETVPLTLSPTGMLAESALAIAAGLKRSFYDSLYLALAVIADCSLVTADRKLFDAVKNTTMMKKNMLWVEDVPPGM